MTLSELLSLLRITRCSDISLCPPQSTQIHFKGSWFSRRCLIFKVPSALAAVIESISYHIPLVKYLVVVSSRFLPRSLWGAALSISYSKPFVNTFFSVSSRGFSTARFSAAGYLLYLIPLRLSIHNFLPYFHLLSALSQDVQSTILNWTLQVANCVSSCEVCALSLGPLRPALPSAHLSYQNHSPLSTVFFSFFTLFWVKP